MKKGMIKVYNTVALFPITLFIFTGIYEMFIGDLIRGIILGNVSWIVPVTQTMMIDTMITLIAVSLLINGFPKFLKTHDNNKKKILVQILLTIVILVAAFLFVIGKLYLNKVVFHLNYLLFMLVLLLLCVIQKIFHNMVGKKLRSLQVK